MTAPQTSVSVLPDIGVPGQIADMDSDLNANTHSKTNREASASMPFGIMVKRGTGDDDALLITAANNKLAGVTIFDHNFHRDTELTSAGLKPGATFGVMFRGAIVVSPEDAVTPASGVHIRINANGGNTQPGAFRGTADATHSIDASAYCQWLTSGGAGGLAVLYVDCGNSALGAAD